MANPMECRERAKRCVEQAAHTADKQLRQVLFEMAGILFKLATALERSNAQLDDDVLGALRPRH